MSVEKLTEQKFEHCVYVLTKRDDYYSIEAFIEADLGRIPIGIVSLELTDEDVVLAVLGDLKKRYEKEQTATIRKRLEGRY